MDLGWSVKKSKVAWRGRFPVVEDLLVADHDGREHLYTYLGIRSTAVGILAIDGDGRLSLIDEYRHPVGRVVTDIPMGSAERGEEILYGSRSWRMLPVTLTDPSAADAAWPALGMSPSSPLWSSGWWASATVGVGTEEPTPPPLNKKYRSMPSS